MLAAPAHAVKSARGILYDMVDQSNPGDIQPTFSISGGGGWLLKTLRVFDKLYI